MDKLNRRLKFIGRGSAFNTEGGNTSAYIKENNTLLLIDCGETTFSRIKELNLLDNVKNVYILITHFHSDHVGSLSSLLFYCYYKKGIVPNIFVPDINNFITFAKLQGNLLSKTYKFFDIGHMCCDDIPELGIKDITCYKVNHDEIVQENFEYLNGVFISKEITNWFKCLGYLIEFTDESLLYYSGDTYEINEIILDDYLLEDDEDCILFQDTCLTDYKGNVHCSLNTLVENIPKDIRNKVYCMHLDNEKLESEAKKLGFNVVNTEYNTNPKQDIIKLIKIIQSLIEGDDIEPSQIEEVLKKYNLKLDELLNIEDI